MHFVGFLNLIQAICLQSLRLSIKSTKTPRILQIRVLRRRIVCQDIRITNIIHLLKESNPFKIIENNLEVPMLDFSNFMAVFLISGYQNCPNGLSEKDLM